MTLSDGSVGYYVPLPPNVKLKPGQHGPIIPDWRTYKGDFVHSAFVTGQPHGEKFTPPPGIPLPPPTATVGSGGDQHQAAGVLFNGGNNMQSEELWVQYNPEYQLGTGLASVDLPGVDVGPPNLYFPCVAAPDMAGAFEICVGYYQTSDVQLVIWDWPQNNATFPADLTTGHVGNYTSVNIDSCNAGPTNCSTYIITGQYEYDGTLSELAWAWDWNAEGYSFLGANPIEFSNGQTGHGYFEYFLGTGTSCPVNGGPSSSAYWGLTFNDLDNNSYTGSSLPVSTTEGYYGDGECLSWLTTGPGYYGTEPDGSADYLYLEY